MMRLSSIYRNAFEDECFELIAAAYKTAVAEQKYKTDWLENDYTELLGHYINESRLSLEKGLTCKTEYKIIPGTDTLPVGFADKLPRIDFVYSKIWRLQRFHYYMEAKRLKEKDTALKRAYIIEGMDRYISKKYPKGCMLGYLLEGNTNKTVDGINSLLHKDKRLTEILNPKSSKWLNSYFESNHSGIGTLKHLVFDFAVHQKSPGPRIV